MRLFHHKVNRDEESAPWATPFGYPEAAATATFNPMLRTAAQLAPPQGHSPAPEHTPAAA